MAMNAAEQEAAIVALQAEVAELRSRLDVVAPTVAPEDAAPGVPVPTVEYRVGKIVFSGPGTTTEDLVVQMRAGYAPDQAIDEAIKAGALKCEWSEKDGLTVTERL